MKKKKMNKFADLIIDKLNSKHSEGNKKEYVTISDDLTFEKFEKLIKNILNYNCSINISDGYISLFTDSYKKLKFIDVTDQAKTNIKVSEESILEISISNNDIFTINCGYTRRSRFKREGIYKQFYTLFKERLDKMNNENFLDTYKFIMKESGLLRDENLNSIITD